MKKAGRYRDLPKVSTRHGAEFCLPARISMQLDSGNGKASSVSHRFSGIPANSGPREPKTRHTLSQVTRLELTLTRREPTPHATPHRRHPLDSQRSRIGCVKRTAPLSDVRSAPLHQPVYWQASGTQKQQVTTVPRSHEGFSARK